MIAARSVSLIPATNRIGCNNSTRPAQVRLRVAAYCRVSSDDAEQLQSYAAQETQEHNVLRQTKRQRVTEMAEFLGMQSGMISEYNDRLTRLLVERILLFEDRLAVMFKSGVEIENEI